MESLNVLVSGYCFWCKQDNLGVWCGKELMDRNKIFLNQMKDYNNLKQSRLQERKDVQAQIFSLFNAGFLM